MDTVRIMEQHGDEIGAVTFGTAIGLAFNWLALIPHLPGWLSQAVFTLAVGGVTIVTNHFIKRELNRRWPGRFRRRGDTDE